MQFSLATRALRLPRRQTPGPPPGHPKSMKNAPVQRSVQRDAHEVRKVRQKCAKVRQRCAQRLQNGAKMEVRDPPDMVLAPIPVKNGRTSIITTIYYTSATSAVPEIHIFLILFLSSSTP